MSFPPVRSKVGAMPPTTSPSLTLSGAGRVVHQLQRRGENVPPQRKSFPIDRFLIGSPGEVEDFATVRDNALQRYRKQNGWELAIQELKRASQMPGGNNDWETWYWIAKIANDHEETQLAFEAATRAVELAKQPKQIEKSKAILDYLKKTFVPVVLKPDPNQNGVSQGFILIEDEKGLIEPNKKKAFGAIREGFAAEAVTLPVTIYLPFGKYLINGQPLEVKQAKEKPEKTVFLLERPIDSEKFTFEFWPRSLTPGRGAGGLFLELPGSGSQEKPPAQK